MKIGSFSVLTKKKNFQVTLLGKPKTVREKGVSSAHTNRT